MIRIDDHTVELTNHELACVDAHGMYLDLGYSIIEATAKVREIHDIFDRLSPEFIAYLNDEEVTS